MAAKLLTQARIRPDDAAVWQMLCGFLAETDHAVIADHSLRAAERRLMADFTRLSEISGWLVVDKPAGPTSTRARVSSTGRGRWSTSRRARYGVPTAG